MTRNLIALVLCVAAFGCRNDYITAEKITDRELQLTATIYTRCRQIGVNDVKVEFTGEKYYTHFGPIAAMWAYGNKNIIVVWREIMRDQVVYPDDVLDAYARHECCHCFYNDSGYKGLNDDEIKAMEARADACARDMY